MLAYNYQHHGSYGYIMFQLKKTCAPLVSPWHLQKLRPWRRSSTVTPTQGVEHLQWLFANTDKVTFRNWGHPTVTFEKVKWHLTLSNRYKKLWVSRVSTFNHLMAEESYISTTSGLGVDRETTCRRMRYCPQEQGNDISLTSTTFLGGVAQSLITVDAGKSTPATGRPSFNMLRVSCAAKDIRYP